MSTDYTIDRADADLMLTEFGQTLTITREAAGTYDPATGTASVTETTQTSRGAIFDFGAGLRNMAGTAIPAAARQCYLSALDTSGAALTRPAVNDKLTDAAGTVHTITAVSELSPDGTDIMYTLTIEAAV